MMLGDFAQVENIEFEAQIDLYRAAPHDVRATYAVDMSRVGPATCLGSRNLEPTAILRRAVGVGVARPISAHELDDVVVHMSARALRYALPVAPHAQPSTLRAWPERRAFTRGYAWMKFRRATNGMPRASSALEIRVVGRELGGEFGQTVAEGFGLPPPTANWIGALPGRASWVCVMAFDGNTPVAAGAAYVSGDYAWLGFGATLTTHRRRGAQTALLERRLREAASRGARVAVTETGELLPDKPSNSYRNILRAGFEEVYLRQNYMSPQSQAMPTGSAEQE